VKDVAALATYATLVLAFATLVTVHVGLAFRLTLRTRPRWRGLAALVVPPLAPIYGFREGWRRTSTLWLVAVIVYVVALLFARG
jgi:hypothetical protein